MAKTTEIGYEAVPLGGGTMTGLLILSGDPVTALGAATKQYADAIAGGFTVKQACVCTTTGNLNATPAGAGVGATLTNAGTQAAFSSDGVSPSINDRILVKDQTLSQNNGIYTLTTIGSGATNWVLTRATDYDQASEIQPGNLVPVTMGTLYAQTSWIETATVVTVDTDPIVFSQFTASPNTFATVALSNLSAVAINTSLLPGADGTIDLGSAAFRWRNGYITSVRTGTSGGNSTNFTVYDTLAASFTDIFTLSAGNPPTATLSGIVTSTTQAPGDNSTKLATTAYADAAVATGANTALSNLASVAINTTLLPGVDNTIDLGSAAKRFRNALIETIQTGTTLGQTTLIQGYNTNTTTYLSFATITAGNPPTMSLDGTVTSITQASLDNSTRIATTAYVDAATGGGAGAPANATYITQIPNATLTNEQALSLLTTGIMKSTTATGVVSIAAAGTDYVAPSTTLNIAGTANEIASSAGAQDLSTNRTWTLSLPNALTFTGKTITGGTFSGATATTLTFSTGSIGTAVTAVTQAPGNNTTFLATTAFVAAAVSAGGGANTALSNLASVAINTDLLGSADNSRSLGSATVRFKDLFVTGIKTGTTVGNNYLIQAYDTNAASYTTFATLTANNPATMALAGGVTGVTQSAADNSTKLATTAYADRMVPLAGGTMTGLLVLSGDPVAALGAVTKQYADAISAGLDIKSPAYAATTANLNATYLNGVAGVGATLVNAGALAAFSVDGVSPPINSRILVKNQTSTFQNGIYSLSTVGSGAVAWVLTRTTDYDQAPSEIFPGNLIIVDNGTVNATTGWIETATVNTIGTDPITFSQFGASLALPVSLANGGTNAALTANNGGIVYSTASALAILAGTATARQMLQSGATAAPTWSTTTWPATTTANRILYSSSTSVIGEITTANSGLLVTDGSGVPTIGTAIPNGVTATTQSAADNSTKVATTAYVDSAASGGGSLTLIASATASNSATVDFANNITSTYDNYLLVWENVVIATTAQTLILRVGTGATPTWQATSYSNAVTAGSAFGATAIGLSKISDYSNTANRSGTGSAIINNVNNASNDKTLSGISGYWGQAGADVAVGIAGRWQAATVVTSIRYLTSSGNITSGVFKLYGLKN